jgi:hypothetical protein
LAAWLDYPLAHLPGIETFFDEADAVIARLNTDSTR